MSRRRALSDKKKIYCSADLVMAHSTVNQTNERLATQSRPRLTASQLLRSELVGLLEDRSDIEDSRAYAHQLREQAQHRRR